MTNTEKIEWAKRAFAEIAKECDQIAAMEIVDKAESNAWKSIANTARRDIQILEQ